VRSRNGNRPLLFTSFILSSALCFGTESYYIGYRFTVKNTQAYNETLSVSKAMQPCQVTTAPLQRIVLQRIGNESFESLLNREKSLFIEFALPMEIRIKSNDTLHTHSLQSLNSLTLPTKCYAVEFNDEFVTITATQ
jgi:hypothetical protein